MSLKAACLSSCVLFLLVICTSTRSFAFVNTSLQTVPERPHSNVTLTAEVAAWTLQVTNNASTCKQHATALSRSSQCTAGKETYEDALTRQPIHSC